MQLTPKIPAIRSKIALMIELTVGNPVILKFADEGRMK
jgi:hypothetical protein